MPVPKYERRIQRICVDGAVGELVVCSPEPRMRWQINSLHLSSGLDCCYYFTSGGTKLCGEHNMIKGIPHFLSRSSAGYYRGRRGEDLRLVVSGLGAVNGFLEIVSVF